jgi:hypothetical protein
MGKDPIRDTSEEPRDVELGETLFGIDNAIGMRDANPGDVDATVAAPSRQGRRSPRRGATRRGLSSFPPA